MPRHGNRSQKCSWSPAARPLAVHIGLRIFAKPSVGEFNAASEMDSASSGGSRGA